MKISILGAGAWGTGISALLVENGHDVRLWDRDMDMQKCTEGADLIVNAIASHAVRIVMEKYKNYYNNQVIVNFCKGIEEETLMVLSDVVKDVIPSAKLAVVSGPNIAREVREKHPSLSAVAAEDKATTELLQKVISNDYFRVYASDDMMGLQLAGSLKNVIALLAGVSDGLGFGDNAKSALMTRGIAEITRLGTKLGAKPATFSGLAGIGDVIVTCSSQHSRNRRAGILIGKGASKEEAMEEIKEVVEGIRTTNAAYELAKKNNIDAPLINESYAILFEGKSPKDAVKDLMNRPLKWE